MISVCMGHFWEALKTGKFVPKTEDQIREFIQNNHFSGEPLVELSEEDKPVIEKQIFFILNYYFNKELYKNLAEQKIVYYLAEERFNGWNCPIFVLEESNYFKTSSKNPLNYNEKVTLFSNPDVWHNSSIEAHQNGNGPLVGWGMRTLNEYGFSEEGFLGLVSQIRKDTGKTKINLLDLGGAMGVMLNDVRKLDKDIITSNMTLDVEPVTYDFDNLYLCPAERFPVALKENLDLIVSNMAFVYMPGQALALENCLQSLSVGGQAILNVEWGKQEFFVPNSARKMFDQYARMKDLKARGFIELNVTSGNYGSHALDYIPGKDNHDPDWFPPARVEIKKLKSLFD